MPIDKGSGSWDNGWHVRFEAINPRIEQEWVTVWLQLPAIFCLDFGSWMIHWKYVTSEHFKLQNISNCCLFL